MKRILQNCVLLLIAALFLSCATEPPVLDEQLYGSWQSHSGTSTYSFADDATCTDKSKSTSGVVITTTTYKATWETSSANTVVTIDYLDESKTDKTLKYEFIAGIDELTQLAAANDLYSRPLQWATDGGFTADDVILLMIKPENVGTDSYWGIYQKL